MLPLQLNGEEVFHPTCENGGGAGRLRWKRAVDSLHPCPDTLDDGFSPLRSQSHAARPCGEESVGAREGRYDMPRFEVHLAGAFAEPLSRTSQANGKAAEGTVANI